MNFLVIPTTDWLRHPVPSRHHFIFERLSKKHRIYVIHFNLFPGRPVTRQPQNVQIIEPPTLQVKDLIRFYTLNAPIQSAYILKVIREFDIDVVFIAQIIHGLSGCVASKIVSKICLSVFDFSDYFPQSASAYYAGKSRMQKCAIEAVVYWLSRSNMMLSDLCIAPSLPLTRLIGSMTGGRRTGHLIPNGVDTKVFKPMNRDDDLAESLSISENSIGFVGSIEAWLDLDTVLEGLRLLVGKVPDAQLVLIGSAIKTGYHNALIHKAKSLGLGDRIIHIGTVPYEQLPRYLSTLKICLIPFRTDLFLSRIALPNKFFEYMACGKPILATRLPEIRRVGADGVLFYETSAEFFEQCKSLLSQGRVASELGARNLSLASSYDWDLTVSKLEAVIGEAVTRELRSSRGS